MDLVRWRMLFSSHGLWWLLGKPARPRHGVKATRSSEDRWRLAIRRVVLSSASESSPVAAWAESFMFAGTSALLLLVANLFPHYWYVSFFALTPFLYRIIKASPGESLRLGLLLGLSFFGASMPGLLAGSAASPLLKLLCGTALFGLFGCTVGLARRRWGFNPSVVALLWVGLQAGLMKFGCASGLLWEGGWSHPFLHGLIGLFGFLAASAIIVFLNSLFLLVILKTLETTRPRVDRAARDQTVWSLRFTRNLFAEKVYLVPEGRAPPAFPYAVFKGSVT